MDEAGEYRRAFGTLQGLARPTRIMERCELCSAPVADGHPHLFETKTRRISCACDACALLFSGPRSQYRRIPRRIEYLAGLHITDSEWDSMMIPIGMAFFFENSREKKITALYPGPGGATESLLGLETWRDIAVRNPRLEEMESDVEALLANRLGAARGFGDAEYYILPIDECFRLVGLIRSGWRGLSGGTEVWETLRSFFASLKNRAVTVADGSYA